MILSGVCSDHALSMNLFVSSAAARRPAISVSYASVCSPSASPCLNTSEYYPWFVRSTTLSALCPLAKKLHVQECVFSLVTPRPRDFATVRPPYSHMGYIGFVIHGKGQFCQSGVFLWGV